MNNDLISREALKKALDEQMNFDENCRDSVFDIIDNAPTVDFLINMKDLTAEQKQHFFNVWRNASFKITNERPQGEYTEEDMKQAIKENFDIGYEMAKNKYERPQCECEKCVFRKFTETFINGVVDVMNKNGITSVEQLSEILGSSAKTTIQEGEA